MSTRRLLAMLLGVATLAGFASALPDRPIAVDQAPVARRLAARLHRRALLPLIAAVVNPPAKGENATSSPAGPTVGTASAVGTRPTVGTGPTVSTGPTRSPGPPDCSKLKCVALTMDDGPVPGTAHVLDLLKRKGVHATFFVLGQLARQHPALVRRMVAEGHVVGNHSWSHPEFFGAPAKVIRGQLAHTDAAIRRVTGHDPVVMRPPFGEVTAKVRKTSRTLGESVVLWDVDPLDWKNRKASTVARRVVTQAKRGSIILTHDSLKTTRAAYSRIINGLRARGFTLVTVPELFAGRMTAGKVYLRG